MWKHLCIWTLPSLYHILAHVTACCCHHAAWSASTCSRPLRWVTLTLRARYARAYWNKSGNLFHDLLIRGFSDKVVKTNRSSNLCNLRQKGTSSESSVSMSPKCSRQTRIFRFQRKGYLIVCGQQITTFLKFTSSFTLYSLHLFIEEIIIDADCGASQ